MDRPPAGRVKAAPRSSAMSAVSYEPPEVAMVASGTCGWAGNPSPIVVVRYLSAGALDSSFGSGGVAVASTSAHVEATGLVVANGLVHVVATLGGSTDSKHAIAARFLGNGTLDSGFGSSGFATAVGEPGVDWFTGTGAVVDAFGNIVVVGERQIASPRATDVFLVRWLGN